MTDEIDKSLVSRALQPTGQVMNLRSQLKFYLEHKDTSATELSRESGVSKQVVSLWLAGSKPRNLTQVKLVAEALGTTVDHLCFGKGLEPEKEKAVELDALLGSQWVAGIFEVKFRRIKQTKE